MFKNLFKKASKVSEDYDIHHVSKDCWTVHLSDEQTSILASKGLKDVRELTLTKGEQTWKVEYSYLTRDGSWENVSSGGIAFSDKPLESVLDQFFNC